MQILDLVVLRDDRPTVTSRLELAGEQIDRNLGFDWLLNATNGRFRSL